MLNKLFGKFKKKSLVTGWQSVFANLEGGEPVAKDLDAYEASWLVYSIVRKISENVALKFDPKLFKIKNNDNVDEIFDHNLLDLLAKVNSEMTRFEIIELTQTHLELTGNAFWLKVRAENSDEIIQIEILRPDWVEIKHNEDGEKFYTYRQPTATHNFRAKDIIHFHQPNPRLGAFGQSSVKAPLELIKTLVYSIRMEMYTFLNNARPDFVVKSKTRLNPEEREEFERKWQEKFGGMRNVNRFGFLAGDLDIKELNRTFADLGLKELNDQLVDYILVSFGVNRVVMGLKGINRAESEIQRKTFLSDNIHPRIKRITEKLNEFLVFPDFGEDMWLDYVDPTPENREAIVAEYKEALNPQSGWLSINEVRDMEGKMPVEGGWEIYRPVMAVSAGQVESKSFRVDGNRYFEEKKKRENQRILKRALEGKRIFKAQERLKKEITKDIEKFLGNKKLKRKLTDEQKNTLWQSHEKAIIKDEKMFAKFMRELLRDQKDRALDAMNDFDEDNLDLLNWQMEDQIFKNIAEPVYIEIYKSRGQRADDIVSSKLGKSKVFEINEEVLNAIATAIFKFSFEVNSTTQEALKIAIMQGLKDGLGITELSQKVAEVFEGRLSPFQVERIARTEVSRASHEAELLSYKQNGLKEVEWFTEPTAEDEACIGNHAKVVKIGNSFPSGDEQPPAHPNCICTLLPVIPE